MAARTTATLTNTNADVWHLRSVAGQQLAAITGSEERVLGPASAVLVGDHGFTPGEWARRGPGRYSYVIDD